MKLEDTVQAWINSPKGKLELVVCKDAEELNRWADNARSRIAGQNAALLNQDFGVVAPKSLGLARWGTETVYLTTGAFDAWKNDPAFIIWMEAEIMPRLAPTAGVVVDIGFGPIRLKLAGSPMADFKSPPISAGPPPRCTKCNLVNEYAAPVASYICYNCRV